jgi:hypothetical protein
MASSNEDDAMLRSLLSALMVLALAGKAHAFNPDGATASLTDFGNRHGFSVGVFGLDTTETRNLTDESPLQMQQATLAISWSRGGLTLGVSAGRMSYADFALPGPLVGSAFLTGVTVGQEISDIAGGVVAAEFSAHRYHTQDAFSDVMAVSIRWTRRF